MSETDNAYNADSFSVCLGDCIQKRRNFLNMSADAFCKKIGRSRSTLHSYEHGVVHLDMATLFAIAKALKISPSLLLDEVETILSGKENSDMPLEVTDGHTTQYLYYYDGISNRLSKNILHLSKIDEEHDVSQIDEEHDDKKPDKIYYNATLFLSVKDISNTYPCENIYSGTAYCCQQYINCILQNSKNNAETLFILTKENLNDQDTLYGILSGISSVYRRPCSYRVLLSKDIIHDESVLVDQLKFTRDARELIKRNNCFFFMDS